MFDCAASAVDGNGRGRLAAQDAHSDLRRVLAMRGDAVDIAAHGAETDVLVDDYIDRRIGTPSASARQRFVGD